MSDPVSQAVATSKLTQYALSALVWLLSRIVALVGRRVYLAGEVALVQHPPECFWRLGTRNGVEHAIVTGRFHATNTGADPIWLSASHLSNAKLKPPVYGYPVVQDVRTKVWRGIPLPSRQRMWVGVDFWVAPPVYEQGEDFVAKVVFTDNLGQTHACKKVLFRGRS